MGNYPDRFGTFKATVLATALQKAKKSGMPQFVVRVSMSEYFDQKEGEWFDVSDNNWQMNTYMSLYGRKDSAEDGELVTTMNHQQVCKVFGWDGCGFTHLVANDFAGKIVQVRVEPNDPAYAEKNPVQITWIDTEDADPNQGLQKLAPEEVKKLEVQFAAMWKKVTPTVSAPRAAPKPVDPPNDPEAILPVGKADKKAAMLAKSQRIKDAGKTAAVKNAPVAAPPAKKAPVAKAEDTGAPKGYGKKEAWSDVVEMKHPDVTDEQVNASWEVAIAELAPDADEDNLDSNGWFAVKEATLNDVGSL